MSRVDAAPETVPAPRRQGRPQNVIRPLSRQEAISADQIGRRLHDELRGVLAAIDPKHRGASALSRELEVDRATCQRIVAATNHPAAGAETLVQLPGVQGLRQFLEAIGRVLSGAEDRLASAAAAVDQFEGLLGQLGGSQRLLRQRLESGGPPGPSDRAIDDIVVRESLFTAAAQLTGRRSRVNVTTSIIRPLPGDPFKTEAVRVRALLGHTWSNPAVPLEIGQARASALPEGQAAFGTLDAMPSTGKTPSSLLAPFCSHPLPRVIGRAGGNRVTYVVDAARPEESSPMDVVLAHRVTAPDAHPALLRPAIGEVWSIQNLPAQHLIFDVFLHRDIARRCIPSLELHLLTPSEPAHGMSRWSTRIPTQPRLEILGPGIAAAETPLYPRYTEMLSYVFEQVGWSRTEFVGYRCQVAYPVWRADYGMLFDFTGNELTPPA
ncbi:MAG: hypothetical protein KF866_10415 [Phycisphaeraceae bacterium]|nr:hypothetical protein [Phycisphaeraceae bacterium]